MGTAFAAPSHCLSANAVLSSLAIARINARVAKFLDGSSGSSAGFKFKVNDSCFLFRHASGNVVVRVGWSYCAKVKRAKFSEVKLVAVEKGVCFSKRMVHSFVGSINFKDPSVFFSECIFCNAAGDFKAVFAGGVEFAGVFWTVGKVGVICGTIVVRIFYF